MDLKSRMGHNIRTVRRFLGYSVIEFAEKTCMTPERLEKIEAGAIDIDMDECEAITNALGVDPALLVYPSLQIEVTLTPHENL